MGGEPSVINTILPDMILPHTMVGINAYRGIYCALTILPVSYYGDSYAELNGMFCVHCVLSMFLAYRVSAAQWGIAICILPLLLTCYIGHRPYSFFMAICIGMTVYIFSGTPETPAQEVANDSNPELPANDSQGPKLDDARKKAEPAARLEQDDRDTIDGELRNAIEARNASERVHDTQTRKTMAAVHWCHSRMSDTETLLMQEHENSIKDHDPAELHNALNQLTKAQQERDAAEAQLAELQQEVTNANEAHADMHAGSEAAFSFCFELQSELYEAKEACDAAEAASAELAELQEDAQTEHEALAFVHEALLTTEEQLEYEQQKNALATVFSVRKSVGVERLRNAMQNWKVHQKEATIAASQRELDEAQQELDAAKAQLAKQQRNALANMVRVQGNVRGAQQRDAVKRWELNAKDAKGVARDAIQEELDAAQARCDAAESERNELREQLYTTKVELSELQAGVDVYNDEEENRGATDEEPDATDELKAQLVEAQAELFTSIKEARETRAELEEVLGEIQTLQVKYAKMTSAYTNAEQETELARQHAALVEESTHKAQTIKEQETTIYALREGAKQRATERTETQAKLAETQAKLAETQAKLAETTANRQPQQSDKDMTMGLAASQAMQTAEKTVFGKIKLRLETTISDHETIISKQQRKIYLLENCNYVFFQILSEFVALQKQKHANVLTYEKNATLPTLGFVRTKIVLLPVPTAPAEPDSGYLSPATTKQLEDLRDQNEHLMEEIQQLVSGEQNMARMIERLQSRLNDDPKQRLDLFTRAKWANRRIEDAIFYTGIAVIPTAVVYFMLVFVPLHYTDQICAWASNALRQIHATLTSCIEGIGMFFCEFVQWVMWLEGANPNGI